jgi:hypothetical protein
MMVEPTGAGEVRQDGSTGRLHVSLITRQASQANGTAGLSTQERAQQVAEYLRARQLAAQAQLAPLAANAQVAARQGIYGARVWTAPRLDLAAQALQEQWAPRIAAALSAYARRIEPAKPPRRRWPMFVGGAVLIAGGATAAVIIMNRRNSAPATEAGAPGEAADSADTPREMAAADVNGQGQAT